MNATSKDRQSADSRPLIEPNIPEKRSEIATHLSLVLNDDIAAENRSVTLDFAANSNIATKARHLREFLARAYEDIVAELGAIMRAVGKAGRG